MQFKKLALTLTLSAAFGLMACGGQQLWSQQL